MPRRYQINVRVSREERDRLKELAGEMSVSKYLRDLGLKERAHVHVRGGRVDGGIGPSDQGGEVAATVDTVPEVQPGRVEAQTASVTERGPRVVSTPEEALRAVQEGVGNGSGDDSVGGGADDGPELNEWGEPEPDGRTIPDFAQRRVTAKRRVAQQPSLVKSGESKLEAIDRIAAEILSRHRAARELAGDIASLPE